MQLKANARHMWNELYIKHEEYKQQKKPQQNKADPPFPSAPPPQITSPTVRYAGNIRALLFCYVMHVYGYSSLICRWNLWQYSQAMFTQAESFSSAYEYVWVGFHVCLCVCVQLFSSIWCFSGCVLLFAKFLHIINGSSSSSRRTREKREMRS